MTPEWNSIQDECQTQADAIHRACVLEATAPKAGNVSPGHDFDDLTYQDFVAAAQLTADAFRKPCESFSQHVLAASRSVAEHLGTNVNLGILLLLGPLAQAEPSVATIDLRMWQRNVVGVLGRLDSGDSVRLYAAINAASPGGMGESSELDLSGPPPEDFLSAMRVASEYDLIAENYTNGFSQLFGSVVPVLSDSIATAKSVLHGISIAHVRLLTQFPDSLITRKFGASVANDVQQRACFDPNDAGKMAAFDRYLRSGARDLQQRHRHINPGTTADLIAAGLFLLLRAQPGEN